MAISSAFSSLLSSFCIKASKLKAGIGSYFFSEAGAANDIASDELDCCPPRIGADTGLIGDFFYGGGGGGTPRPIGNDGRTGLIGGRCT